MKKILYTFILSLFANYSYAQVQLYGLTAGGGANGYGVVFQWNPVTNSYTKKIDFIGSNGREPRGSLTESNGKLYGTTYYGGTNGTGNPPYYGYGVIFEWDPATNIYTKKIDFAESIGFNPTASLTLNNNKFYGTTTRGGGASSAGTIFEWDPVTNIYTKKIDFDYLEGASPIGPLTLYSGKFYGVTGFGGVNSTGVIFEWDPVTNIYTKKIDFNNSTGDPHVDEGMSLSLYSGKFYGVTGYGGINNGGVIFEWDPVTNIYTKKIDFETSNGTGGIVSSNGSLPVGSLVLNGDKFYGMTVDGGGYPNKNYGVIYEWDPITNIYTKKIDFNSLDGANPKGSLVYSGSKFYGTTSLGGTKDQGVIFEWDPVTNVYTKKSDFDIVNGARGIGNLIEYSSQPLPLKLLQFSATPESNNVRLEWEIAKAENGSKYELLRGTNGRNFTTINQQNGDVSITQFNHTDKALSNGTYYYRLQMVDIDGKITYSPIIKIVFESKNELQVFPNPAKNIITLSGLQNKGIIKIIAADGRVIKQLFVEPIASKIDVSTIAKGFYLIEYSDGGKMKQVKFLKE